VDSVEITNIARVKVKTGKVKGAGTDANVFLIIYGQNGETNKIPLKNSLTNTNKFEAGCLDIFNLDATDVGKIQKIRLGHDNAGLGASWFVDSVEITNIATGDVDFFPCNKWFDKKLDDKQIERDLVPAAEIVELKQDLLEEDEEKGEEEKGSSAEALTSSSASKQIELEGKILCVTVLSGTNLIAKDSGKTSDPYCKVGVVSGGKVDKSTKQKTKVIKKTLNPTWEGETFRFNITPKVDALEVTVWDEDKLSSDEFMGIITIPKSDFVKSLGTKSYTLKVREGKDDTVSGEISLQISLLDPQ